MRFQLARLYKLYHHLKFGKLGHEKFDFSCINSKLDSDGDKVKAINQCGTMGCAIGELPIIDRRNWKFGIFVELINNTTGDPQEDVNKYFGLTTEESNHLFYPRCQSNDIYGGRFLTDSATKEQVADNILEFINWKLSNKN